MYNIIWYCSQSLSEEAKAAKQRLLQAKPAFCKDTSSVLDEERVVYRSFLGADVP